MRRTRILHTADWHLGHQLLGHARKHEHEAFLSWLVELAVSREVDAVIVAGDVFDGRSPSGDAQAAYFRFLASLRERAPTTEVLVIAGNHDSPSRLAAAGPVLGMLGVHVVGAARPGAPPSELVKVLRTRAGHPLTVAAVPFVRPSDLSGVGDGLDPAAISVALAALYRDVVADAERRAGSGPVVATGHAHLRGALLSPRSERPVYGGDAGALERTIFPSCSYVALGHLHLSQDVSAPSGPMARYAGSPIPLALAEASYAHAVALVELEGRDVASVVEVPVPRTVAIEQLIAGSLEAALSAIERLARATDLAPELHPWLEIRAPLAPGSSAGAVRAQIEAALRDRAARLVRLALEEPEAAPRELAEEAALAEGSEVDALLRQRWREVRGGELSPDHERALATAVQSAMQALSEARIDDEAARTSPGALQ